MSLGWNRYGKSKIRLVKVRRDRGSHNLIDLTIDVQLEGAFDAVYLDGDNASCLATDTMKNTVYALARQHAIDHVEAFAGHLATHFVTQPSVTMARVSAVENPWDRISVDGRHAPDAFVQPGGEHWTTVVVHDGDRLRVTSGLANLVILKTARSGFAGFPRDRYTTLAETDDRILATSVSASWNYREETTAFGVRERIRRILVETFATHDSRSVQETLYAMGRAVLAECADVVDITLSLPNRHHLLVDLRPFGLDNPNEVFVATDQPYGVIEATVVRD